MVRNTHTLATGRPEHPPELADRPTDAEADMPKARAFFYVCAGLFLLALSYHLGARSATAQAPGNPVVALLNSDTPITVATANGDIYRSPSPEGPWTRQSNVFGAPTPAQQESFGGLKAKYRGER